MKLLICILSAAAMHSGMLWWVLDQGQKSVLKDKQMGLHKPVFSIRNEMNFGTPKWHILGSKWTHKKATLSLNSNSMSLTKNAVFIKDKMKTQFDQSVAVSLAWKKHTSMQNKFSHEMHSESHFSDTKMGPMHETMTIAAMMETIAKTTNATLAWYHAIPVLQHNAIHILPLFHLCVSKNPLNGVLSAFKCCQHYQYMDWFAIYKQEFQSSCIHRESIPKWV